MIKNFLFLLGFWLAFALILYSGISLSLCKRVDSYSEKEQESMQLTPADCAKPFYKRM